MRTTLEQLCNNFISNRDAIKSVFKWENEQLTAASATSFLNRSIRGSKCKPLII